MFPVIEWKNGRVYMLDQRRLPMEEKFVEHATHHDVARRSIREMVIRGAPAIGVAAAMGIALGVSNLETAEDPELLEDPEFIGTRFAEICQAILSTRPTAFNLFWAAERMKKISGAAATTIRG